MAAKFSHNLFGAILMFLVLHPFAANSRPIKFESFPNLKETQKGDVVYEINQVKQFLKAYGYYPHEINDEMDDKFDYALESALRAYQQFYRLNVTGKIDPNTLKAMSTPRCGVPDINIEQTSNYVLFGGRMKWYKYDLTYNYLSNSSQVPDLQDLKLAIARAFQTWRNASKFTFTENTTPGANTDIGIGFFRRFHEDGEPFDGPPDRYRPNVVAHATPPQSRYSFLHFDADEIWSTNPAENTTQVDIESIALHELGHILGLNHSQKEEAVMYAIFPGGQKRVLDPDDIDGITDLYK